MSTLILVGKLAGTVALAAGALVAGVGTPSSGPAPASGTSTETPRAHCATRHVSRALHAARTELRAMEPGEEASRGRSPAAPGGAVRCVWRAGPVPRRPTRGAPPASPGQGPRRHEGRAGGRTEAADGRPAPGCPPQGPGRRRVRSVWQRRAEAGLPARAAPRGVPGAARTGHADDHELTPARETSTGPTNPVGRAPAWHLCRVGGLRTGIFARWAGFRAASSPGGRAFARHLRPVGGLLAGHLRPVGGLRRGIFRPVGGLSRGIFARWAGYGVRVASSRTSRTWR